MKEFVVEDVLILFLRYRQDQMAILEDGRMGLQCLNQGQMVGDRGKSGVVFRFLVVCAVFGRITFGRNAIDYPVIWRIVTIIT